MEEIKIEDLVQVWSIEGLCLNLFQVYDIYKSEYGGYIYECFKIKMLDKNKAEISIYTDYIRSRDIVGVFKPTKKLEFCMENK